MSNDIIAAIATPYGKGGIAIIRLSGEDCESVLQRVFKCNHPFPLQSHMLTYGYLIDGQTHVDECMAVVMRAPHSYTRENVCEIHVHGGIASASIALNLCLQNGARMAQNGEFTRRAFENGRIDLSQAEAVMALISAQGKQSQRLAMRELEGGASRFIRQAQDILYTLMASLEAAIDYPDEVDEQEATDGLINGIKQLAQSLLAAIDERGARIIHKGLSVALCGAPNVGKSSLLNALLGEDRAIVTDIPGTTRDVLTGTLEINGIIVHLSDTAGLHNASDAVEQMGIARAKKVISEADVILQVLDCTRQLTSSEIQTLTTPYDVPLCVLLNKCDLPPILTKEDIIALCPSATILVVSALEELSLEPIKAFIASFAGDTDALIITNHRHLSLAKKASDSLFAAVDTLEKGISIDLAAVDMREALSALGEITGDEIEERVLDTIFSAFCVGK